MALFCPIDFDIERLRREIGEEYTKVAENPDGEFHFNRGFDYAVELLRYDPDELAALPEEAVARFAGIGNPLRIDPVVEGEVVLDVGCGAGTDLLLAARRVGQRGRVIGVDPTLAMREVARRNARRAGLDQVVDIRAGHAEELPIGDAQVDVVISNGVLNLSGDKTMAFGEIARVLRPGGRLLLADVVLRRELSLAARSDIGLWAG